MGKNQAIRYAPYARPVPFRAGRVGRRSGSGSSSRSSRGMRNILNNIVNTAAAAANARTQTTTKTKTTRSNKRPWVDTHGKRPVYTRKKRVINQQLKGRMAKFQKKVMKVMEHVNVFGEYIYISTQQLRQKVLDRYSLYSTDFRGVPVVIGSDRALADAAAVLFNLKPSIYDYETTSGNFTGNQKINLVKETLEMYFKSTSSHVVNIQMFEFTSKTNQDESPASLISESLDDYTNSLKATWDTVQSGPAGFDMPGTDARHLTSVHQKYYVKVHSFKLPPGETATKFFSRGPRTFDPVKDKNAAEQPYYFRKGCSYFYFRVINDITVSGHGNGNAVDFSQIHNWPSNKIGGVAFQYKRTIRVQPPSAVAVSNNRPVLVIGCMKSPGSVDYVDQQVAVQNPVEKAITDV